MFAIEYQDDNTAIYRVVTASWEEVTRGTVTDNGDGTFTSEHVCGDVAVHDSHGLAVWHLNDVEMLASASL